MTKVKIRITKGGIYGANGEVPIGTELTLKEEPKGWKGRYEVISAQGSDVEMIVNPDAELRATRLKELSAGLSEEDFTASGAPDVKAVNALLDEGEAPFTAKERNALWMGAQ